MRGFQSIDSVILELENNTFSNLEKIDLLLNRLREFLIEEAEKKMITFPSYATTKDMVVGLNFIIFEYRSRKKFNTKLIISILTVMSSIQHKSITFKTVQDLNLRDFPVYVYEDDTLTTIKSHNKTDNLNVVLSLIDYLSKTFLNDLPNVKKYTI